MRERTMIAVIVWIAAKAFPGESGWFKFPGAIVCFRRSPVKMRHRVVSLFGVSDKESGAMILSMRS